MASGQCLPPRRDPNELKTFDEIFRTGGEIFCLDLLTGQRLWHNPLKGYGTGLATIATENSLRSSPATVLAEKRRCDEQAADAAAASTTMHS